MKNIKGFEDVLNLPQRVWEGGVVVRAKKRPSGRQSQTKRTNLNSGSWQVQPMLSAWGSFPALVVLTFIDSVKLS